MPWRSETPIAPQWQRALRDPCSRSNALPRAPAPGAWHQIAARRRGWRSLSQGSERIQPRPGVQGVAPYLLPSRPTALGRGHQRRPCLVAACDDQLRRNIRGIPVAKEGGVSLEYGPQADASSQPVIIEQEGGARGPVCTDDALVAIHG